MQGKSTRLRWKFFSLMLIKVSLSAPACSFSQQFFSITYGHLTTDSVTANEFRAQKELKAYNMRFDKATAYFHIAGKKMQVVTFRPVFDAAKYKAALLALVPGSIIGFDGIVLSDSNNNKFQPHNLINYYIVPDDHISSNPTKSGTEITRLSKLRYTSGNIYFKIPGQRPETININSSKNIAVQKMFGWCTPETVIVFENVYYRDDKDKLKGPLDFTCRMK
jgi:hypothetical protein